MWFGRFFARREAAAIGEINHPVGRTAKGDSSTHTDFANCAMFGWLFFFMIENRAYGGLVADCSASTGGASFEWDAVEDQPESDTGDAGSTDSTVRKTAYCLKAQQRQLVQYA